MCCLNWRMHGRCMLLQLTHARTMCDGATDACTDDVCCWNWRMHGRCVLSKLTHARTMCAVATDACTDDVCWAAAIYFVNLIMYQAHIVIKFTYKKYMYKPPSTYSIVSVISYNISLKFQFIYINCSAAIIQVCLVQSTQNVCPVQAHRT